MLSAALALTLALAAGAQPAPVLPLATAPPGTWPAPGGAACGGAGASCGDVRAVVTLAAGDIAGDAATVQVWWRRRDPHPEVKGVIVLDAAGGGGFAVSASVERDCGLVSFSRAALAPGVYNIYYLPYRQAGGGAGLEFSWFNCSDETPTAANLCVQGRRLAVAPACAAVAPSAAAVTRIENRDAFNAFTVMEQMATGAEAAAAAAALAGAGRFAGVFPEDAAHSVRVFDGGIPARWALGAPAAAPAFAAAAAPGQWLAFQVGLWAFAGAIANVTAAASPLAGPSGALPAGALTVLNLGGVDSAGAPFTNGAFGVAAGAAGSLWCGLAVPAGAAAGAYSGTLTIGAAGAAAPIAVALTFTVAGAPVPDGGALQIDSMARLAWLNSARGLEDTVPAPFEPVSARAGAGGLVVTSLRKVVALGGRGLPENVTVAYPRVRRGAPESVEYALLRAPVDFAIFAPGGAAPLAPTVVSAAAVATLLNASVSWAAAWTVAAPGGTVAVTLSASLDFASVLSFDVTLAAAGAAPVAIGDVQLSVPVAPALAAYIVGMDNGGAQACAYKDRAWRWTNATGANKVYVGAPEAGLLVNLKGDGPAWDSPMFGADYPIVPFVPPTWGGADALPVNNPFGVNITNGTIVAFSGARTLAPGATTTFRFALQLLPSKATNWTAHWATRTQQLGYDVPYASPADVAARGVTVATLHQGTPGIVNGSLINPWINYPFLNDTVPLLTNFTAQANALGVAAKFYYTIRELSARAPEVFAFKALAGEVLVDEDPYTIVQPGYAHRWNTHGGAAFLHQHLVSSYGACWQQSESDGSTDPSVCTHGTSRLFNYYVEGLAWSFSHAPFINGIYYDGTNFDRTGMIRIRRAADAAAAAAGRGFPALLDLHTGREGTPDTCSYASHYPLINYVWNGEGFDFSAPPAYWLLEISTTIHGVTGDMLGSGSRSIFRGLVFGMTQRDAVSSQAIWRMWDAVRIAETDAVFAWWERGGGAVNATVLSRGDGGAAAAAPACNFTFTHGSYTGSANEQCLQPSGPTPGCWAVAYDLATVEAACCADAGCAGFSFAPASGVGCCKGDQRGSTHNGAYDGYAKVGWHPPAPDGGACVLATTWSRFGERAVIAVATWCGGAVNATLAIDWAALGLDAATARASLPAIDGVQAAAALPIPLGAFAFGADGGAVLLLEA